MLFIYLNFIVYIRVIRSIHCILLHDISENQNHSQSPVLTRNQDTKKIDFIINPK